MSETPFTVEIGPATLRGTLHVPETAGPCPAVLWLHGFGGTRVEATLATTSPYVIQAFDAITQYSNTAKLTLWTNSALRQ